MTYMDIQIIKGHSHHIQKGGANFGTVSGLFRTINIA